MMWMKVRIFFGKGFFPLLFSSLLTVLFLTGCAEDSRILDNGQNRQLEFSVSTHGWDNSNKSSNQKVTSRASPISTFDTSKNFNVIADVNNEGNWTTEVNNETASYSTTNKIWQTTATHYWPGTGSTVNFYAYYPISIFGNITHNTGSAPILSYTVPDNAADQIDILTSSKTGVAGNSYIQTSVDFKHIFAAVQFQVGSSGLPSGTITKVILNNIQYKGTYNLDGTWTPNTTDKKSFSQTVSASSNAGTVITSGVMTFMMMPQTLSDASVTVTYSNGGTLTKAITGTWEAGKTYTYNLSKTIPVANFDYTGDVQSYTVPLTGTYKLEVWGAQGYGLDPTTNTTSCAGYGGYVYGNIVLNESSILYIAIGGQGAMAPFTGLGGAGYNGGGNGHGSMVNATAGDAGGGGGGATHISFTNRGILSNYKNYQSEIILVAGGGGGSDDLGGDDGSGGSGGGTTGGNAKNSGVEVANTGGTQTLGYAFGQGGNAIDSGVDQGGGGGGWYGGQGAATIDACGGGGGSGHLGSALISGTTGMQNGIRSGNGHARITFVSAN
jgi:hypothetical protein